MPVSLNYNIAQVTSTQPKKQPEIKSEAKSSISAGTKIAIGTGLAGLAALAATGIYIATKGKIGKNIGTQIELLTQTCKNISKIFNFETPQVGERLEEISKLSQKEKLTALKQLNTTLDHAAHVRRHVEFSMPLAKGMKTLPDDVRQAYEQKDVLKTGELFKQHLDKLPNTRPAATKGATVAESIENTFGKGTNIQPHTYDLSKESPVIGVWRNAGGYKDGFVGQKGIYYTDSLTPMPDFEAINLSASHAFCNGKDYGSLSELGCINPASLENPDRKLVQLILGKEDSYKISVLSPNNEYTPLQKDLIKLIENPEKIDKSAFDKLTEVASTLKDMTSGNLYKNLDYDVLLSAIQSMAK